MPKTGFEVITIRAEDEAYFRRMAEQMGISRSKLFSELAEYFRNSGFDLKTEILKVKKKLLEAEIKERQKK